MIIDVHAHVYAFPKIRSRPDATPFLSADEQIAVMDAKGVDRAVILPIVSSTGSAEPQSIGEVLHVCAAYPGRFIPFCNVDPRIGKRPDRVEAADFAYTLEQYRDLGCKGLGEVTARVGFDDPALLALFAACERVGFPVTFHTTTPRTDSYGLLDDLGLPRLERALRHFPKLALLGHSQAFWSEIGAGITPEEKIGYPGGPVKPGGRVPELLRRYPNLYGDLSASSGLNALRRDPAHAYAFLDEFQDRLLLGLDYCSVRNDMQHIEWFKAARDAGHISAEVCEKIFWRNADRVLGLGL
jgi:predicted TIM-barrel fold metal-dependent hydrolase